MDLAILEKNISTVLEEFHQEVDTTIKQESPELCERLRVNFLGKKSPISSLMTELKDLSKEEKPRAGKMINDARQIVEAKINELKTLAINWEIKAKLTGAPIDISLPHESSTMIGSAHPVTLMRQTLVNSFRHLGFTVYDGPELDFEFFNFTALNLPAHHPARDMQDTFHIANHKDLMLRSQTSTVQIHAMLREKPPLRIIAPGRVFRCDSDPTHTPMFHQIEALVVDENISFADLKGTIDVLLKSIFHKDLRTRFRPSFFPFTEPSAEVDLMCTICMGKGIECRICKNTGWLEVGGCGMVHPNVFDAVNYDSEKYTGFAFGFGIDRLAMLKYKLSDLRTLFEGNHRFLSQFPISG